MTTTATAPSATLTVDASAALTDARAGRTLDAAHNAHHPTSLTQVTGAATPATRTPRHPGGGPREADRPDHSNAPQDEPHRTIAARPNPTRELTRLRSRTTGQTHLSVAAA